MPWYEDDCEDLNIVSVQEPIPSGLYTDVLGQDPYSCTLEIKVPPEEVPSLKSLYSPLLQWIDPAFRLLRIKPQETTSFPIDSRQGTYPEKHSNHHLDNHLSTQSLSVVLFLRESAENQLTANAAKHYLEDSPWVFHHKIELANRKDMRTVARQYYYQSSPDLPLWTICSVHYGNEQLRFNIFVRHFQEMKEFYQTLTGAEISASKSGFCTFDIYSQPGLDIKLSLKYSPYLTPSPCKLGTLKFAVHDISYVKRKLRLKLTSHGDNKWIVRDPDGNNVILSRDDVTWCDEWLEEQLTDLTDSGQWSETPTDETTSDCSSWDTSWDSVSI